jgi:uncharacterized lipoprotein NlpE involved in copper resistance
MKKIIFALAILLVMVGCDNGTKTEPPSKSMDSRLIGDNWYDGAEGTRNTYYRFTDTDFITTTNGVANETTTAAYTENGQILATADGSVLLTYVFVDSSEYDDEILNVQQTTPLNQFELYKWQRKKQAAQGGNMVRFTVAGVSFDWARWARVP